jgi:hypothetical protein
LDQQAKTTHTKINKRIDASRAGELLARVDELSDGELDTLLAEMLVEEKVSE